MRRCRLFKGHTSATKDSLGTARLHGLIRHLSATSCLRCHAISTSTSLLPLDNSWIASSPRLRARQHSGKKPKSPSLSGTQIQSFPSRRLVFALLPFALSLLLLITQATRGAIIKSGKAHHCMPVWRVPRRKSLFPVTSQKDSLGIKSMGQRARVMVIRINNVPFDTPPRRDRDRRRQTRFYTLFRGWVVSEQVVGAGQRRV